MFSYYYLVLSIFFHGIIVLVLSFSLSSLTEKNLKKNFVEKTVNATFIDESDVRIELERIKALESRDKIARENEIRNLRNEIKSQEKKLKSIESQQKKAKIIQKNLENRAEVTQKEIAQVQKKKEKERKALEAIEKNRILIENKNKELEKETKALEKKLAENELLKQLQLEEKIKKAEDINDDDIKIIDIYAKKIEAKMKNHFKILPGQEGLSCTIRITLVRDGSVVGVEVLNSSGDFSFDRSAENAVFAVAPFPVPESDRIFQKMREITFVFSP